MAGDRTTLKKGRVNCTALFISVFLFIYIFQLSLKMHLVKGSGKEYYPLSHMEKAKGECLVFKKFILTYYLYPYHPEVFFFVHDEERESAQFQYKPS